MPAVPPDGARQSPYHRRVELGPRAPLQLRERRRHRPGPAVRAGRGHRVEGVGHRHHPGQHRDLLAGQPVRVAGAVDPLVVVQDRGPGLPQEADAAHHLVPVLGVQLDDPAFLGRERPVLAQQPGGDAELADVVQDPGDAHHFHPVLGHAQLAGDHRGGLADPFTVAARVAVLDVDRLDEGADGGLVGGALAVVLGEDPAGDVHRQQDEEGCREPVRAAPHDGHHQAGEGVDAVRGEGAGEQAAPGGGGGPAFGGGQDAPVEGGEHQAEGDGRGRRGKQYVGKVGHPPGRPGPAGVPCAEGGRAAQQREHLARGPGGYGLLRAVPHPAHPGGPLDHGPRETPGQCHERGGGRRQQEDGGEHHGEEGADALGHPAAQQRADLHEFAAEVEHGEQGHGRPGRAGIREGRGDAGECRKDGAQDVSARPRRKSPHGALLPCAVRARY